MKQDWAFDDEAAAAIREVPARVWQSPDALPLRPRRRRSARRLRGRIENRVEILAAMPDWMVPLLVEEEPVLWELEDWWEGEDD